MATRRERDGNHRVKDWDTERCLIRKQRSRDPGQCMERHQIRPKAFRTLG